MAKAMAYVAVRVYERSELLKALFLENKRQMSHKSRRIRVEKDKEEAAMQSLDRISV